MLDRIRTQLAPPIFEGDEDKTRIASLLHIMLFSIFVIGLIFVPIGALTKGSYPGILIIVGMLSALAPVMLLMLRRGYVESVSVLLVSVLFVAAIASVSVVGSIRVPVASLFILCVVIAGLLFGHRGTVVVTVLSLVALLGLWWAETAGLLPPYVHEAAGFAPWLTLALFLISTAVLLILATRGLNNALERVRRSEQALTESNRRLKAEIAERKQAEDLMRSQRDLGLALSAARGIDEVLRLCVETAIRVSGMDCGGIYFVDETSGGLHLAFHRGLSAEFVKSAAHYEADSPSTRLVMAGEPIYTRYQELGVPLDETHQREALQAVAIIPLSFEGQVIACLNIASYNHDEVPDFARTALEAIATRIGDSIVRAQTEEDLRESEEKYRSLIEQSGDAIYLLFESRFEIINPKFTELFGVTQEEARTPDFNFMTLVAPRSRPMLEERMKKLAEGKELSPRYEFTALDGGGNEIEMEVSVSYVSYRGGTAIQGILRDITERKQAEREREVLQYLALELTAPLTLKELVKLLAGHCRTLFSYDSFRFDLYDEQGQIRIPVYAEDTPVDGQEPVDIETESETKKPQIIRSIFDGKPVLVNRGKGMVSDGLSPWGFAGWRSLSMMFVPVRWQGRCTGVIYTHSYTAERYSDRDLVLLQMVADQCGAALARAKAEGALRDSERRYRLLAENVRDTIWVMDMNLQFTYFSPSVAQLGYTVEEAMSLTMAEFLTPASREVGAKTFAEELSREDVGLGELFDSRTLELEIRRKDGSTLWVEVRVSFMRDAGGQPIGILGVARDITERKRAKEALRQSEEKYRTIYDNAQVGLYRTMFSNGKVLIVNKRMAKMWGYESTEDCIAHCVASEHYADPGTREKLLDIMREHGKFTNFEARITKRDGTIIWLQYSGTLFPEKGYFEGVATDITERVRAVEERELLLAQIRAQAKQIQQTIDTVPEGVLLLDAEQRVVLANPAAERHLAVLAEAKVGDTLTRLGDRPLAELLTLPPTKGLWHEVKTDGRTFEVIARPMEPALSLPNGNGPGPENWVLVIRDVTQEREVQQRVQQQERLAAVGQLAAGIAHDFNNIMSVIVLYTYMALGENLPPKTHGHLETVSRQAKRATDLIQQILDFSRRAVLERRPMDLTPFLKEVVKLLERTVPESIKMRLTYGTDEYTVNADPTRMQQAIMNLVVNARDAMPEGGELRIKLERVQVESHKEPPLPEMEAGEWVRVRVTDTGSGVPPDALPHVFEPFFTTKGVGKGTGLGLAQVYGIVKQHEGHVDVSTEVGAGTTFTLYLPALLASPPEAPALATEDLVQGQGETVLVVEDNATLREALTDTLELLNYRVLEAANGREALDILERHAGDPSAGSGQGIALVLSDLVMPEMGGQELFHAMRQRGLTLPVVMLSGHPMENELKSLQAQGLAGWMLKPLNMEQLAQLLARALSRDAE